jgi:hypothetical protein
MVKDKRKPTDPELAQIDALYGLEPVFEPGSDPRLVSIDHTVSVRCPHCGERYETPIDVAYGSQRYIEDCQICCSAIELVIEIKAGQLERVQALRLDGSDR